ncbi:unnamed protein product [Closterium sp. Naga37s-1]|nr:unnamed protein product [Closterium sp. Naga37s-1]
MRVPVVASPPIPHPSQRESATRENAGESTPSGGRRSLVGSATRTKTGPVASPQPAWFPRVKLEPYLTRRLRELQEEVGPQPPLEQLLIPSKLGRLEREKQEAAMAAQRASQLRQVALVEASWCRILDAAGIPSGGALEVAKQAEDEAHEAVVGAARLGVVLDHAVTSRSRNGSPRAAAAAAAAAAGSAFSAAAAAAAAAAASAADDELIAASALAGALSSRDVILTSVSTAQAVEKEVVLAVMKALSRVGNIRAADGIVDFVDWEVKEGEEREGEEEALGRECGGVEVEKGDGAGEVAEDGKEAGEEKGVETGVVGECDGAEGETGKLEVEKEEEASDGNESQGHAIIKREATEASLEVGDSVAATSTATAEAAAAKEPTAVALAEEGAMGEGSVAAGAEMQEEKEEGKTMKEEEETKVEGNTGKEEEQEKGKKEEEEEMDVPAVIAERVLALNRNQRTALAAIVASRGMVNGLLQGLRNGRRQSFSASATRRQSVAALSQIGGTGEAGSALAGVGTSSAVGAAGGLGEAEQAERSVAEGKEAGVGGASGGKVENSSGSGDLGSILVKKLSRLEREKAAAVEERKRKEEERRKAKTEKKGGESVSGVNVGWGAEGLGSGIKHVSRIDRELAAARQAERKAQGRGAGAAAAAGSKNGVRVGRRERVEVGSVPSLDSMLVKGKSRLQREKEEAAEAAKQALGATGGSGSGSSGAGGKGVGRRERVEVGSVPGLDSMLVVRHKSKLEREMEEERKRWGESSGSGGSGVVGAHGGIGGGGADGGPKGGRRERVEEGSVPGLGEMLVKHKSRLEREKEEAAAWARGAGGSGGGTGTDTGADGANGADGVDGGSNKTAGMSGNAHGESRDAVVDAGWRGCGLADVLKKPAVKGGAEQGGEGATTDAAAHDAVTGEGNGEGGVEGNENEKGSADGSSGESGGMNAGVENGHSDQQKQQQQQGLGLGEGVKKMSRLERELMEARALRECVGEAGNGGGAVTSGSCAGKAGGGRVEDAWGGVGLGDSLKKHVSKMERAKMDWEKAEAAAREKTQL